MPQKPPEPRQQSPAKQPEIPPAGDKSREAAVETSSAGNEALNLGEHNPDEEGYIKHGRKLFIAGTIATLAIVAASAGFFFIQNKLLSKEAVVTLTPSESIVETEKPQLNRSEWTLEVLNGSGVAGAAKKAADDLATLGYTILLTGNADASSYKGVQVEVTEDMQDKADALIADLTENFKEAKLTGLLKGSAASARIIIGR